MEQNWFIYCFFSSFFQLKTFACRSDQWRSHWLKSYGLTVLYSLWVAAVLLAAWTASVGPTWLPQPSAGSSCSSRWSPAGFSGVEVGAGICSSHVCSGPEEGEEGGEWFFHPSDKQNEHEISKKYETFFKVYTVM